MSFFCRLSLFPPPEAEKERNFLAIEVRTLRPRNQIFASQKPKVEKHHPLRKMRLGIHIIKNRPLIIIKQAVNLAQTAFSLSPRDILYRLPGPLLAAALTNILNPFFSATISG